MLTLTQLKNKSAAKISTLQEPLRTIAGMLVDRCYARGIMIVITEALRTYEYQNQLYAKGRNSSGRVVRPKDVVTNARGGFSIHNFGFAFDFALLLQDGRSIVWDTRRSDNADSLPDWSEVVLEAKKMGLEWGGDWRSFVDMPHFQMVFGLTTSQFRAGVRPSAAQVAAALNVVKNVQIPEAVAAEESVSVAYPFYTGEKKGQDPAFVYGSVGVSYVSMRDLAGYIGVPYYWDNLDKRAFFNATAEQAGSGERKPLQDYKLIDGRVYVQLRPIAAAYGKKPDFKEKRVIVA